MTMKKYPIFIGSGSYLPTHKIRNQDFLDCDFFGPDGQKLEKSTEEIIKQFESITGIFERRYVTDDLVTSDIAVLAAKNAIESSGIDPETLDCIIVAHNFGDIQEDNRRSEFVPSLASRVKSQLNIKNPDTIAYDIIFGCPGWLQGVIQSFQMINSDNKKRTLIIGAETLSRITDPHDRDSMIYADGAGAIIIDTVESEDPVGILSHGEKTYSDELAYLLSMGPSNNREASNGNLYLKMQGRTLYENVLKVVPKAIKESIEQAGLHITDIKKVLIHQANNKMDEAILSRLFREYGTREIPKHIMPMTISWLGNSSVATLPTLYDLLSRGKLEDHEIHPGDVIVLASVGAGVNVNSVVYKVPA
jgi:3-oxoacyl-[acyl-carrier-protein] synthase-3